MINRSNSDYNTPSIEGNVTCGIISYYTFIRNESWKNTDVYYAVISMTQQKAIQMQILLQAQALMTCQMIGYAQNVVLAKKNLK